MFNDVFITLYQLIFIEGIDPQTESQSYATSVAAGETPDDTEREKELKGGRKREKRNRDKSNEMIEIKTNRILREYSAFSHK